jgi:hypothetical protein
MVALVGGALLTRSDIVQAQDAARSVPPQAPLPSSLSARVAFASPRLFESAPTFAVQAPARRTNYTLAGFLLGGTVGAIIGVKGCRENDCTTIMGVLITTGVGAAVGALIGFLASPASAPPDDSRAADDGNSGGSQHLLPRSECHKATCGSLR